MVYLVSKQKFHSVASEEELGCDLEPEHLNTEDGHRVIQAKIRYECVLHSVQDCTIVPNWL